MSVSVSRRWFGLADSSLSLVQRDIFLSPLQDEEYGSDFHLSDEGEDKYDDENFEDVRTLQQSLLAV